MQAKFWFRMREAVNWVITIAVFVPLYLILRSGLYPFLAAAISVAIVYCLFFFILDKRAIKIICPENKCKVMTNTPWICGVKGCRNENVDDFPFIFKCEHCKAEPKAYKCHHCGNLIFFTADRQTINYAQCINYVDSKIPSPSEIPEDEFVKAKREAEVAEMNAKKAKFAAEAKKYDEKPKEKKLTPAEQFRKNVGSRVELEDEVRKMKAEADEEFKNDRKGRKKRHETIEEEKEEFLKKNPQF